MEGGSAVFFELEKKCMYLEKYSLDIGEDKRTYEFYSFGPKGRIRKVVQYQKIPDLGENVFNLSFGDLDEKTGDVDDNARSNNIDTDKILATVVDTLLDFTRKFPDTYIYVEGGTPARTRLYQMRIAANLEEIYEFVEIYGFIGNHLEPFLKNKNYEGFLARIK